MLEDKVQILSSVFCPVVIDSESVTYPFLYLFSTLISKVSLTALLSDSGLQRLDQMFKHGRICSDIALKRIAQFHNQKQRQADR